MDTWLCELALTSAPINVYTRIYLKYIFIETSIKFYVHIQKLYNYVRIVTVYQLNNS